MYLRKVTLQGFKSFAKKTVIDFEPGITAIVGPNGSGKSNVSDAIKWVLGEQSMKNLRSKKSEDVIFAGSGNKAKSGVAEVSIELDNRDKIVPIDYTDVVITRRVYRSGDSEYLLNGAKARLMDITEILSKSGFGRSTYTVIGQGMVDKLITQTTDERRELFQDASGVKHFYLKRDQALKKFQETRDNLTRVSDVVRELKPRLSGLERKQEEAKERKNLTQELRSLQKKYYGSELLEIKNSLSDQEKKYDEASGEVNRVQEEINLITKKLEQRTDNFAKKEEEQREQEVNALDLRLEELQANLLEMVRQDALQVERLKYFKENLPRLKDEKTSLEKQLQDKKREISDLTKRQQEFSEELNKLEELKKNFDSGESLDPRDILQKIKKALSELSDKLKKDSSFDNSRIQKEIEGLISFLNQHDEESFNDKATEKVRLDLKIEKIQSELESRDSILAQAREVLGMFEERLARIEKEIEESNNQDTTSGVSGDNKNVEEEIEKLKKERDEKKRELEEIKNQSRSKESEFFEIERQYREKRDIESQFKDELTRVEIEIARLKTKKEDIATEISEIGFEEKDLELINIASQERSELLARVNNLRHKLEFMGGAISHEDEEEYDEVKKRYDFLTTQSEDLKEALKSTRKVVVQLESKIHDQFHDKFEKISQKFNHYFGKLFGGGAAKLILKEGEKDEDMIIEIQAIPPGKRMHTLNTLSGGEKSLTSIALLFAIFAVNPTPFCVLDEVDAALDESNSVRITSLLMELGKKTQFIVVSHNRETMKSAQTLYGVTMDESKVSQVLSLKLGEAQKYSK